jgi:hypothetical protein
LECRFLEEIISLINFVFKRNYQISALTLAEPIIPTFHYSNCERSKSNSPIVKPSNNSYFFTEDGHFLQFQGSRAGLLKQLIYGGFFTPSAFSSLKLGAAVSPIDKLLKDSALPPVHSEKPTLFFKFRALYCYELTVMS